MQIKGFGSQTGRLALLILFQAVCTLFFVVDMSNDMIALGAASLTDIHSLPELGATVGLVLGMGYEVQILRQLLRRQGQLEQAMSVASGALAAVIEGYYRDWGLTAAEQDVAGFTIKGFSISEIATLRGSAPGTVKTHLNAIYRKAGVTGRGQLVSLLVEDLLCAPLVVQRPNIVPAAA